MKGKSPREVVEIELTRTECFGEVVAPANVIRPGGPSV